MTFYDSYNVELAAKQIKSVVFENFTEACSLTNEKKYDVDNSTLKYMLYKQCIAWSCYVCSIAKLMDYINNPIYQELPDKSHYFAKSNEQTYFDLRASNGYTKEMEIQQLKN